jgi:hypothetical protein
MGAYMKMLRRSFFKFLIIIFAVTPWIQHIQSMEDTSSLKIYENKTPSMKYTDPDLHRYMLLSSLPPDSFFWLPKEVVCAIGLYACTITDFLTRQNFCCDMPMDLLDTTLRLNTCFYPSMSAVLLKIILNEAKKSIFGISHLGFTIFDYDYGSYISFEESIKFFCSIIEKKELVDHFKGSNFIFTTNWHRLIHNNASNTEVIKIYLNIFIDYAKDSSTRAQEVLKLFTIKDLCGDSVLDYKKVKDLDLSKEKARLEMYELLKNTKKELKRIIAKKEHCVVQ